MSEFVRAVEQRYPVHDTARVNVDCSELSRHARRLSGARTA